MAGLWPGLLALLTVIGIIGGAFGALLARAPELEVAALASDVYLRRVALFTVWQALLSTLLSVGIAVPVARALARRQRFLGREWLIRLLGLPLVIPTIVAVFGIVVVYGRAGWMNDLAAAVGLPRWQHLYGLPGILIAHVFFNLPLAIRLVLPLWATVPGETWRLAGQLGMGPGPIWRLIEWPLLRQALPGVAGLIFMLCFTSFAVVLTLGGGPATTTIEVAIYQALRFDFDLGRATLLALLELGCCALLVGLGQSLAKPMASEATPGRSYPRTDSSSVIGRVGDGVLIGATAVIITLPLAATLHAGLSGPLVQVLSDERLWRSASLSLVIALSAASLSLLGGWNLLLMSRELSLRRRRPWSAHGVELCGSVVIVVPPLVLGTGFFIALSPLANVFALGPVLVVIVNALMGLPYVIRVLGPRLMQVAVHHDRLCASLGIRGWHRLRWVEWPLLRRPVGLALALCAALSTGDLGVIALFGTQDTTTLPLLLYQRMSSYQMDQAAVTALVLVMMCLGLFVIIERAVGGRS